MSVRATTPEERFEAYLHRLGTVMGHADRLGPLRGYLTGLLLPGERKSVEPMAAKLDPTRDHGVLCIAAYAFLAAERARLSPPAPVAFLSPVPLPEDFQMRGAASTPRAPQPSVHHHPASSSGAHASPAAPLLPVVRGSPRHRQSLTFMTQ